MHKTYHKPKVEYEPTDTLDLYVPHLAGMSVWELKQQVIIPAVQEVLLYNIEHNIRINTDGETAATKPLLSHAHNTRATEEQCICHLLHPKHLKEYPGEIGIHGWDSNCDIRNGDNMAMIKPTTRFVINQGTKYIPEATHCYSTTHADTMGTQQTGYMPRLGAINKWSKKVAYTATRHSVRWELTPILDEMALGTAVTTLQESLTQHIMMCLARKGLDPEEHSGQPRRAGHRRGDHTRDITHDALTEHFTYSVLDKSSKTLYWECAYAKSEDLQHKIAQPGYEISHLGEDEETLVAQILEQYQILCPYLLPTTLELPYMYSTYKEEKKEHRYITAGDSSILALMATLVDTCLQTIMICETEQCVELTKEHLTSKGLDGKYMWRCKDPYTVGLNIPDTASGDSQILSIDAKKCYDNIPLVGNHSLSDVISEVIFRAFQYKGKNLTVLTDLTRPGEILKVRWCSPSRGDKLRKLATQQWHEIDVENLIHINIFLMTHAYVNVQGTIARQTIGIPMGLSACVMWCDLWLHYFERDWVERCVRHSKTNLVSRITPNIYRIIDDLGGIIRGNFLRYINPADESCIGDDSVNWVYPTNIITIKDTSTVGVITGTQDMRATETTFLHMFIWLSMEQGSTASHGCLTRLKVNVRLKPIQFTEGRVDITVYYNSQPEHIKRCIYTGALVALFMSSNDLATMRDDFTAINLRFYRVGYPINTLRAYWEKFLSTTFGRMHCKLPELTKGSFKQWKITGSLLNNKRKHEEVTTLHMQMHGMNGAMGGRLQSNMQSC